MNKLQNLICSFSRIFRSAVGKNKISYNVPQLTEVAACKNF